MKYSLSRLTLLFALAQVMILLPLQAQDLPEDELQINFSSYFDNFDVSVIYPSISLTKKVSETTSVTGRYLVDMVSAASISQNGTTTTGEREDDDDDDERGGFRKRNVDGVSAASSRGGLGLNGPDDIRHELNAGVTQLLAGRVVSFNTIYSRENDYQSATIAGTLTQYLARKNTSIQLGYVHSWDKIFPVTQNWTRNKQVSTVSVNLSQILSKRLIGQVLLFYSEHTGYLADPYKMVTIGTTELEPVSPDSRVRKAISGRLIYRLNPNTTIQGGYRYYWDSWNVTSHTVSALLQRHLSPAVDFGLGFRSYLQSDAYFFESRYLTAQDFMTVDNKLDRGYSNEIQFKFTLKGGQGLDFMPMMEDEKVQWNIGLNIYQRQTNAPDWFNNKTGLLAANFNIGLRYKL